jgi:hypothetical protein
MNKTAVTAAYSIKEFCESHRISPSAYYEAKREGWAPREMRIGAKGVRISAEAAAEWRRAMERRAAGESTFTSADAAEYRQKLAARGPLTKGGAHATDA